MTPTHIDTPIRRNVVATTPMSGQFASRVFEVSFYLICLCTQLYSERFFLCLFVCFRSDDFEFFGLFLFLVCLIESRIL